MKQYTRKQLKEYARLGLARDLTEVDPDTLPKWYEKIGVSRGNLRHERRFDLG